MSTWYSASLIFEATHDLGSVPTSLWEEKVVLIEATEETEARAAAEQIGRDGEHEYEVDTPQPHKVRWRFRNVDSVYEILSATLENGVEVFSRLLASEQAEVLLKRSST